VTGCVIRVLVSIPNPLKPDGTAMAKMLTSSRSLLLAGALAFAALPALAQTAPQTQSAAPSTGATTATTSTSGASTSKTDVGTTGKTAPDTTAISKSPLHSKKVASAHKSNVHRVSTKKHATTGTTQRPTSGSSTGTSGTQPQ
jgi:hypothetical protein